VTSSSLRRLIHAGTAIIVLVPAVASWDALRGILIGATVLGLLFEIVRIKAPESLLTPSRLSTLFRSGEANCPSGAWWLSLGYCLAAWVPQPGAAAGIVVGALADPAASLVGSSRGQASSKTAHGSGAAFAVAILAMVPLGLPWTAILGGAVIGTALERWSGPLDDNLLLAPGVAAAVWLLA
jgi:dolichol kinase